jgi:Kef-type K+ transport system membrane component KefB
MNWFAQLLLVAAAAHGLARWLRLPALPLLILAGMAINPGGLLGPAAAPEAAGDEPATAVLRLLEFALVFLVFASGVELNPRRFARRGATVAWVGTVQFAVSALVGVGVSLAMGFGGIESAYLGIGLAASSTLVVLHQLKRRQAMFEPFGRVVTGVLLLQDVILVAAIIVLARLGDGRATIGLGLAEAALLGGAAWLVQRHVIPPLLKRAKPDEESLLLWLVAVLFLFVGIAYLLDLPPITGAFAGGFAFSAFPLNGLVRGQLSSLTEFFQSLFFVGLGALVGIPEPGLWLTSLQFAAVVVLATPPLVAAVAEWRGLSARASIECGLLLAQTSEFSLLLGVSGLAAGHLSAGTFAILATTTVITMTLTPLLGREGSAHALLPLHPFRHRRAPAPPPAGHVLVLGFGTAGMWTVKPLRAAGHEVLVVDDDPVVCAELARLGVAVLRGDGSDKAVLDRAGAGDARLIIASMRQAGEALKVLDHVRGVPVVVRVFEEEEADRIRAAGGIPVLNSAAAAETFGTWFAASDRVGGVG